MPKLTLSYGLNYVVPLGGFKARFTLSNTYRSSYFLSDSHAALSRQPAYNLTNLGVGFGSLDGDWEASVLVRNLFDKDYYASASTWSNTAAQSVTWGLPRSWVISFRSKI